MLISSNKKQNKLKNTSDKHNLKKLKNSSKTSKPNKSTISCISTLKSSLETYTKETSRKSNFIEYFLNKYKKSRTISKKLFQKSMKEDIIYKNKLQIFYL